MGTDESYWYQGDGEGPTREITLRPFWISMYSVTNAQFRSFVDDTGYRTEAERFGWSFVFHMFLPDDFPDTRGVAATPWWRQVHGADWAYPAGPRRISTASPIIPLCTSAGRRPGVLPLGRLPAPE